MRLAVRAGLLLMNDDLIASHNLSQQIETSTGSFWHAIMHRRESDFSNANYWWRRTGEHAIFSKVFNAATTILKANKSNEQLLEKLISAGVWLPFEFTDACERGGGSDETLRAIQQAEMNLLFDWCRAQI